MTSPVAVIGLVWDGHDLARPDLDIFFDLAEGLDTLPEARGADQLIPFRAGRLPGLRLPHRRPIVANGHITGPSSTTARADFRAYVDEVKGWMDPTIGERVLVATLEDGSTRWITCVARNILPGDAQIAEYRAMSLEWEAVSDPLWHGSWGNWTLDSGLFLDSGWFLDASDHVVITPTSDPFDATFSALGTTSTEAVRVEVDGASAGVVTVSNVTADGRAIRLVAFGDSITAGTAGTTWTSSLTGPLAYFYNAGIGGDDTNEMLARLETDVLAYAPTDVVIMGGTNDLAPWSPTPLATSLANLGSIIDQVRATGANAWLLTIPPVEIMWDDGTDVETFNAALVALAAAHGATLIDTWALLGTGSAWISATYHTGDGVHPSAIGSAIIGAAVNDAIWPGLAASIIGFSYPALAGGAQLVVDSGNRTVLLGTANARGNLTLLANNAHGEYLRLRPAVNTIRVTGAPAEVRVYFTRSFL